MRDSTMLAEAAGWVGDVILLSTLLEILHRRFGGRCHVIGAGRWPGELYASHADVTRVTCLHRYTAFLFDSAWWRALAALRASLDAETFEREWARGRASTLASTLEEAARLALGGTEG